MSNEWRDRKTLQDVAAAQTREAELSAHVERLRKALEKLRASVDCGEVRNFDRNYFAATALAGADSALIATPAQSLAHLRNEVLEEAANVCDARAMKNELAVQDCSRNGEHDEVSSLRSAAWQMSVCADAIRELKEPE